MNIVGNQMSRWNIILIFIRDDLFLKNWSMKIAMSYKSEAYYILKMTFREIYFK